MDLLRIPNKEKSLKTCNLRSMRCQGSSRWSNGPSFLGGYLGWQTGNGILGLDQGPGFPLS